MTKSNKPRKNWLQFLTSREAAIFLLLLSIGLILPTAITPGYSIIGSPYFLLLPFLLIASILSCTIKRWFYKKEDRAENINPVKHTLNLVRREMEDLKANAVSILQDSGWRTHTSSSSTLRGEKGIIGFIGSMLFHAGLLAVIIGGIISLMTRFHGTIVVVEETTVYKEGFKIIRQPTWGGKMKINSLSLHKLKATYKGKDLVDYTTEVSLEDSTFDLWKGEIGINKPASYRGMKLELEGGDLAFRFKISYKDKQLIFDNYAILLLRTNKFGEDSFLFPHPDMPSENITVRVAWLNKAVDQKTANHVSAIPEKPLLRIDLQTDPKKAGEAGVLFPGELLVLGDFAIEVTDIKNWVSILLVRDHGLPVVFIGFMAGFIGLALRVLFSQKAVFLSFSKNGRESKIELTGHSAYFPALFDEELAHIAHQIELKGGGVEGHP